MRDIQSFRYRLVCAQRHAREISKCHVCLWFFERLMFLVGHKDRRANRDFCSLITFTTHKEGAASSQFLKLAGPKDDPQTWAPYWADPLALMWMVTGRCSMAVNSHKRESWSDAMLAWAGATAAGADYRTLDLCIFLAEKGRESPMVTGEFYQRARNMIDKIWTVWIDGNSPASDRPSVESFERMSTAILFYGKPYSHLAPWCEDPYDLGRILGKGPGPVFSKTLSRLPPATALRLGLAVLVGETEKDSIAAAEVCLLALMDSGAVLKKDDAYLEKLLSGKGVTDALRDRVRATLE